MAFDSADFKDRFSFADEERTGDFDETIDGFMGEFIVEQLGFEPATDYQRCLYNTLKKSLRRGYKLR